MHVELTRRLADLDPRVEDFLAQRVERNVPASLLVHARAGRLPGAESLFAWALRPGGQIGFFAMRTAPWPMLVSELDDGDAEALIERWLPEDPALPGVSGVPAAARALAAAWQERTGGRVRCRMRDAMYVLQEVIDPARWPAGSLRQAGERDRELLVAWERAFVRDAGVIPGAAAEAELTIERRLSQAAQYLWEDRRPVSTLALSPAVAGTVRIGPVYTPPSQRGRGYASAAVATACREALGRGAHRCMLFADLANPTSNKIYAAVGFHHFAAWEELEFSRVSP